jgi:hypothetical protein
VWVIERRVSDLYEQFLLNITLNKFGGLSNK